MSSDPTRPNPEWWQSQDPQGNQGHQDPQGAQGYQGPQGTQRFPVGPGYDQGAEGPERPGLSGAAPVPQATAPQVAVRQPDRDPPDPYRRGPGGQRVHRE